MNIDKMLDNYANWIRSEITTTKFNEYIQITTPFLDHFNDYIQIYVKMNSDGTMELTDGGYTFNNLSLSGVEINRSPTRKQRLEKTARSFGVSIVEDEIISEATLGDFPMKKHLLVQAILRIDDMFITSQSNVKNLFNDDVKYFFDSHKIFYSEGISIVGKTGSVHPYEFHFQRSENQPERFCKTINRLNRTTRDSSIFSWLDIKDTHEDKNSTLIILINDENPVKVEDLNAFKAYNIVPIQFKDMTDNIEKFCA